MELEWVVIHNDKDTIILSLIGYGVVGEITLFDDKIDAIYYTGDGKQEWATEKALIEDIKTGRVARLVV